MSLEPETANGAWEELAGRLRQARQSVESCLAGAPLAGAGRLAPQLAEIAVCLTEAEELWRTGRRAGVERFRHELEQWNQRQAGVRDWIEANSFLMDGWAAATGTGGGYRPAGWQTGTEPGVQAPQAGRE